MNECTFADCDKEGKTSSGLCYGHDKQRLEGRPLKPLRKYKRADIGVPGWRQCTVCEKVKPETDFYLNQNNKRRSNCIECFKEAQNGR